MAPQFQRLQEAMERKRVALQVNTLGIQPEIVLVLETVGSVDNFVRALRKVQGLEWLGEFDVDSVEPEHGFMDADDPEKQLSGQLFMVMTDQEALRQMRSFFDLWKEDHERRFSRGLTPLKHAFEQLRTIRTWDIEDRTRETGILDDWQYRIVEGEDTIPFQIELWFRAESHKREQAESNLRRVIESLNGEVTQRCVVTEIAYHGIAGSVPRGYIQNLVEDPAFRSDAQLLMCDEIMHIRPVGQCSVAMPEDLNTAEVLVPKPFEDAPTGDPIVALLDGLPMTGHQLLAGRIDVDDPDDYESAYLAQERFHGTSMASLICHGDLAESGRPVGRPIYVRPIMKPRRVFGNQFVEAIPQEVLPVDLIHRAVRRLFESESGQPPSAPSVRVINLSVCDPARPFFRDMSPMARLIDWLSWKYNVLFMVSAGNHAEPIELDVPREDFSSLTPVRLQRAIIEAIAEDTRNRRLLSPAETFNGLTVGATHKDGSAIPFTRLVDPFIEDGLPSVLNAHGPGYRRTIKPEILLPGGRQFLDEQLGNAHDNAVLQSLDYTRPPGQQVAAPGPLTNLNYTRYTRGTSNATALASRNAMRLHEVIERLRLDSPGSLPREYDAVLLKALLVHGCDWDSSWFLYENVLMNGQTSRSFRDYVARFLGYGSADVDKVMACTDQRVTVLGVGSLFDGEGDEFMMPLPPSLSAVTENRRLIVTLAWLTPVSNTRQNYRVAHLWFNPTQENVLGVRRQYADYHAAQRGTVQHEVLDGRTAVAYQDGDNIVVKVNCRSDAGDIEEPIRYALAVSLQVAEGIDLPIYQEVRDRLQIQLGPRP